MQMLYIGHIEIVHTHTQKKEKEKLKFAQNLFYSTSKLINEFITFYVFECLSQHTLNPFWFGSMRQQRR